MHTGASAVGLIMDGPWAYGALVNNIWSLAGDTSRKDVNQMTLQPFVNDNFKDGWYASSSPLVTANGMAEDDNRWTLPVGGASPVSSGSASNPSMRRSALTTMSSRPTMSVRNGRSARNCSSCSPKSECASGCKR